MKAYSLGKIIPINAATRNLLRATLPIRNMIATRQVDKFMETGIECLFGFPVTFSAAGPWHNKHRSFHSQLAFPYVFQISHEAQHTCMAF